MHQEALGSGVVEGGIGGIVGIVIIMLSYLLRITTRMSRRGQRNTPTGGQDEAQGGGIRQREAGAPPAALSAEEQEQRERAHAYWEAEQPPEGTLAADGFIGDDADGSSALPGAAPSTSAEPGPPGRRSGG
jgi:hypothetical protein